MRAELPLLLRTHSSRVIMPIRIRVRIGDADQWITVHPNGGTGTHILIGSNGEIKAGAGGKFNGQRLSSIGTKSNTWAPMTKRSMASNYPPKLTANEKSALSSYSGAD